MALAGFSPSGIASLTAIATSQNVALPGTPSGPPTAVVTNLGPSPAFVALGTTNAVVATLSTGVAILPGTSLALTLGANTYLAAITSQSSPAILNIAVGT